jgi:hypothetical protein
VNKGPIPNTSIGPTDTTKEDLSQMEREVPNIEASKQGEGWQRQKILERTTTWKVKGDHKIIEDCFIQQSFSISKGDIRDLLK